MTKSTLALLIIALTPACSEEHIPDRAIIPFAAEWTPVYYTMGSDNTKHLIRDCQDNFSTFSNELNEFISGNLLIGDIEPSCSSCPEFRGQYTWSSRCAVNNHYSGAWSTYDRGVTVSFDSESLPDSTLQFKSLDSPSERTWKLRYDIGEESVIINYNRKRN